MNFKTNPYKAVKFNKKAIENALKKSNYLTCDIKLDGVRGNILVDENGESKWLSRASLPIFSLAHLVNLKESWSNLLQDDRCLFPHGFMLDGELTVKANGSFHQQSGILRTIYNRPDVYPFNVNPEATAEDHSSHKVPFMLNPEYLEVTLYGIIPYDVIVNGDDYDTMNCLMTEHLKLMLPLLKEYIPQVTWRLSESYFVYDMNSLQELYEEVINNGHEGLVIKDPQGIYKRGARSGWWKMKPELDADGEVIGVNWGTKGLSNENKVIGFEVLLENGNVVSANNISQSKMIEYTNLVLTNGDDYFNGWKCQVKYMEKTPDGSLRHPCFDCFRGTEDNPTVKI